MREFHGGIEAAQKVADWVEMFVALLMQWIMATLFRRRQQLQPVPQPAPANRRQMMPVDDPKPQAEPRTVWTDKAMRAKARRAGERLKAESDRKWQALYLRRYLQRKLEPGTAKRPHPKAVKLALGVLAYANTIDQESAAEIVATPTDRLARDLPRIESKGAAIAAKAIDPTVTRPNAMPPARPAWLDVQEAMEASQAAASAQAIINAEIAGPQIDPAELEAVPDDFGGAMPPEIDPDDLEPLPPTSP